MRFRSKLFAILATASVLGFIVWALCTQLAWVRSNEPIRPPVGSAEQEAKPAEPATAVIGNIKDPGTQESLQKGLKRPDKDGKAKPR